MSFSGNVTKIDGVVSGTHVAGQFPADVRTITASVTVATNSDKTGYSLTAGSYSVRASSSQRGSGTNTNAQTQANTISSVTTTRASCYTGGADGTGINPVRHGLTSSTNVNAVTSNAAGGNASYNFEVAEFF